MGCWRHHWQSGCGSASFPKTAPAPEFDIWQPWGSWERFLGETWRPGGHCAEGGGLGL